MIFRDDLTSEKEEKPEFVEETIDEIKDANKYIENFLLHYNIQTSVKIEVTGGNSDSKTCKFEIGEQKGQMKINNGKLVVRIGGGWITLKVYIGNLCLQFLFMHLDT